MLRSMRTYLDVEVRDGRTTLQLVFRFTSIFDTSYVSITKAFSAYVIDISSREDIQNTRADGTTLCPKLAAFPYVQWRPKSGNDMDDVRKWLRKIVQLPLHLWVTSSAAHEPTEKTIWITDIQFLTDQKCRWLEYGLNLQKLWNEDENTRLLLGCPRRGLWRYRTQSSSV